MIDLLVAIAPVKVVDYMLLEYIGKTANPIVCERLAAKKDYAGYHFDPRTKKCYGYREDRI